jgi:hypothetical protein
MTDQKATSLKRGDLVWVWHNNQVERATVAGIQPVPRVRASLDTLPGLQPLLKQPHEVAHRKRQLDDGDKPTQPPPWLR